MAKNESDKSVEAFDIRSIDVELVYNSLESLIAYGTIYKKHYNFKQLRHLADELDDNLTHGTALNINRANTHLMYKALTFVSDHFDLFTLICESEHLPKSDIQSYKHRLPKTLKLIHHFAVKMIMNVSPATVKQRLVKDKHFIQHGFVSEALNDMFKGFRIDHFKAVEHPTDMTSTIALYAIRKMDAKHSSVYDIYNVDDIITGTIHCLHHNDLNTLEFDSQEEFLHDLRKFHKHHNFVIVDDSGLHKVNQKQALELVNTALDYLDYISA